MGLATPLAPIPTVAIGYLMEAVEYLCDVAVFNKVDRASYSEYHQSLIAFRQII
jgi:hypothetical protein